MTVIRVLFFTTLVLAFYFAGVSILKSDYVAYFGWIACILYQTQAMFLRSENNKMKKVLKGINEQAKELSKNNESRLPGVDNTQVIPSDPLIVRSFWIE